MINVVVERKEIDGEKGIWVKTNEISGDLPELVEELLALTKQIYFYLKDAGESQGKESAPFIFRFVMEMLHEVPFLEEDIIPAVEEAFNMLVKIDMNEEIDEKGGN
ncbi:MAG: hypothetical protein IKE92_14790 [Clostridiales bacterium]|nr:hypothetical protein [Clostridiales bacterium]